MKKLQLCNRALFIKTGISEFSVRLHSVIFGVLSVLFIYLLSKNIFNRRVGLIASLILALSSYNIYYSQEARTYALFTFLSILSMYFFLNYLKNDNKHNLIYYFASTVFLMYSHYYSIFALLVQNIFFFIVTGKKYWKIKKWLLMQFLIFLAYLPAIIGLASLLKIFNKLMYWTKGVGDLNFVVYNFSGGKELSILFTLILLYGFIFIIRNKVLPDKDKQMSIFLIFWAVMPLIVLVICSLVFKPLFLTRYIIFSSIPFYILVAYSIDKLNKYFIIAILISIIIFSSFQIKNQFESVDKEPWNNVSYYVKGIANDGDIMIIEPGYYITPFLYYYMPRCFNSLTIFGCATNQNIYTVWNQLDKESHYIRYANRIIYIKRESPKAENRSEFFKSMTKNFEVKSKKEFPTLHNGDIDIYLLTSNSNN